MAWTHGGVNAEACRVQTPGPGYEVSDSSFHGTISLGQLVRLNEVALPQSRHVEVVGYSEGNHGFLMSLNPESLLLHLVSSLQGLHCMQPPSRVVRNSCHVFSHTTDRVPWCNLTIQKRHYSCFSLDRPFYWHAWWYLYYHRYNQTKQIKESTSS